MSQYKRTIQVSNLPSDAAPPTLKSFFETAGNIQRILYRTSIPDSIFVVFEESSTVGKAVTRLSGEKYLDTLLKIRAVPEDLESEISTLVADADLLPLVTQLKSLSKDRMDRLMVLLGVNSGASSSPGPHTQPRIPTFSGDNQKGDITYMHWRYHLKCLMQDETLSSRMIMQAIRLSVRGTAAEVLMYLGEKASPSDVLTNFDKIFASALSSDQLLIQLFTAKQSPEESLIAWSCRLQQLYNQVKEKSAYGEDIKPILRSILFLGLWNKDLITATRHNFETDNSYDDLLAYLRKSEVDCPSQSSQKASHQPITLSHSDSLEKKMDKALDLLSTLEKRVSKLESKDKEVSCTRCLRPGHERERCFANRNIHGHLLN